MYEKAGYIVIKNLQGNHTKHSTPKIQAVDSRRDNLPIIRLDTTTEVLEYVAQKVSGGAGLWGMYGRNIKLWILHCFNASTYLREAYTTLMSYMVNISPL